MAHKLPWRWTSLCTDEGIRSSRWTWRVEIVHLERTLPPLTFSGRLYFENWFVDARFVSSSKPNTRIQPSRCPLPTPQKKKKSLICSVGWKQAATKPLFHLKIYQRPQLQRETTSLQPTRCYCQAFHHGHYRRRCKRHRKEAQQRLNALSQYPSFTFHQSSFMGQPF